jgi:hypothetical protein
MAASLVIAASCQNEKGGRANIMIVIFFHGGKEADILNVYDNDWRVENVHIQIYQVTKI